MAKGNKTRPLAQAAPMVKQTKCLGWLLFLAPEYDLAKLCKSIYQATAVHVALCFWSFSSDSPEKRGSMGVPQIKAIHLEVDQVEPKHQ